LQIRHLAALELVRDGVLAGDLALSYVIFPSDTVLAASESTETNWSATGRLEFPPEVRAKAVALVEDGHSWSKAGQAVGASTQSVGLWVRAARTAEPTIEAA
jgi:hypothetical protein